MSQRKEKYNRHMMRQYEGIAKDVDYLNIRTEVIQRELKRVQHGWYDAETERCCAEQQVRTLTRNQRKAERMRQRRRSGVVAIILLASTIAMMLWHFTQQQEYVGVPNVERIPVSEPWVVPTSGEGVSPYIL